MVIYIEFTWYQLNKCFAKYTISLFSLYVNIVTFLKQYKGICVLKAQPSA